MSRKLARLVARRELLVAQAAAQRNKLGEDIEPWRIPLARVDQGLGVLRYIQGHPILIVGAGLLLAALPLGRAGKWAGRGWMVWQMVNKLRSTTSLPIPSTASTSKAAGRTKSTTTADTNADSTTTDTPAARLTRR